MSAAFKRFILAQTTASLSEALRLSEETEHGPKGGLLILVKNIYPAAEIHKSINEDTEFLGIKLMFNTLLSWRNWNTLGRHLQDSKNRLHGSSPTFSGIWDQRLGDRSQDAHQQTGQSSEHRLEDSPWCHENQSHSWNGEDRWSWTTWGQETGQTYPCRKDEEDARLPHAPKAQRPHKKKKRLKRKSLNHLVKEQQKEHADILTTDGHLCEKQPKQLATRNPTCWDQDNHS